MEVLEIILSVQRQYIYLEVSNILLISVLFDDFILICLEYIFGGQYTTKNAN